MLLVTTLSYDQLGALIRNKSVSLDNDSLVFGQSSEPVRKYLMSRLGGTGYVVGIRGRINQKSAQLLSQLDRGLQGNKLILEAPVSEDEAITFNVQGIEEAVEILTYGLPDEMLYEQLDSAIVPKDDTSGVQIICVPAIEATGNIRITSLNREIEVDAEGITFVKLGGVN